jgi:hypothetical protein|tara:strand:- start:1174 stop:1377 length:204 start_codon:yes stop_codon:yes gene_type:complete
MCLIDFGFATTGLGLGFGLTTGRGLGFGVTLAVVIGRGFATGLGFWVGCVFRMPATRVGGLSAHAST